MKISLDISKLNLREVEDIEEVTGRPIGSLANIESMPAKALRAIIWITQRRTDPAYTYEMTGDVVVEDMEFERPPVGAGPTTALVAGSRPSRNSTGTHRKNSGR